MNSAIGLGKRRSSTDIAVTEMELSIFPGGEEVQRHREIVDDTLSFCLDFGFFKASFPVIFGAKGEVKRSNCASVEDS